MSKNLNWEGGGGGEARDFHRIFLGKVGAKFVCWSKALGEGGRVGCIYIYV